MEKKTAPRILRTRSASIRDMRFCLQLDGTVDFSRPQTSSAYGDLFGRTVYNSPDALKIWQPSTSGVNS